MNTDVESAPGASVNQSGRSDQSVVPVKMKAVGVAPKARAAKTKKAPQRPRQSRGWRPGPRSWSAAIAAAMISRRPSGSDATPAAAPASRSVTARPCGTRRPRVLARRRPQSRFIWSDRLGVRASSLGSGPRALLGSALTIRWSERLDRNPRCNLFETDERLVLRAPEQRKIDSPGERLQGQIDRLAALGDRFDDSR